MPAKWVSNNSVSRRVFGHRQKTAIRVGLYARVSTHDQQTLSLQRRAMHDYVERRGWTIAIEVKEVGSGPCGNFARNSSRQHADATSMLSLCGGSILYFSEKLRGFLPLYRGRRACFFHAETLL